jgi:predicted anti-sigma-YlaC factor YlaD
MPFTIERALELNPAWDSGALQILLVQVAPSLPAESGGGFERAEVAWKAALEAAGGRRAGHYVAWAKSVCVPRGDVDGFRAACEAALAVDPDADPNARLSNALARAEASALLASIDDFFLIF